MLVGIPAKRNSRFFIFEEAVIVIKNRKVENVYVVFLFQVVTEKTTRASKFATGGGVGMIIMGSASVAVFAKRFLTRGRAS